MIDGEPPESFAKIQEQFGITFSEKESLAETELLNLRSKRMTRTSIVPNLGVFVVVIALLMLGITTTAQEAIDAAITPVITLGRVTRVLRIAGGLAWHHGLSAGAAGARYRQQGQRRGARQGGPQHADEPAARAAPGNIAGGHFRDFI